MDLLSYFRFPLHPFIRSRWSVRFGIEQGFVGADLFKRLLPADGQLPAVKLTT